MRVHSLRAASLTVDQSVCDASWKRIEEGRKEEEEEAGTALKHRFAYLSRWRLMDGFSGRKDWAAGFCPKFVFPFRGYWSWLAGPVPN